MYWETNTLIKTMARVLASGSHFRKRDGGHRKRGSCLALKPCPRAVEHSRQYQLSLQHRGGQTSPSPSSGGARWRKQGWESVDEIINQFLSFLFKSHSSKRNSWPKCSVFVLRSSSFCAFSLRGKLLCSPAETLRLAVPKPAFSRTSTAGGGFRNSYFN